MAFIDIPGWPITYPYIAGDGAAPSLGSRLIDADTEKLAFVVRCPKAGTLNRVGFSFGTVSQAPTNGLTVSFQDLTATGNPDGTQDQTRAIAVGSIATDTWVTTGLITSDGTDTGTKRTVTQGELLAVVVEFTSFVAGDSVNIHSPIGGLYAATTFRTVVYADLFTGAWAKSTGPLPFALQYSDGTWEPAFQCLPAVTVTGTGNYSSASTPDVYGMKFTCPVAMRTVGFVILGSMASSATGTLHLYDSNDTELAAADLSALQIGPAAGQGLYTFPFSSVADSVDLSTSGVYRVVLEATSANDISLSGLEPPSSSFASAHFWGENAVKTSRKDAGAWTDATDGSALMIGLLISAIDPVKSDGRGAGLLQGLPPFLRSFLR